MLCVFKRKFLFDSQNIPVVSWVHPRLCNIIKQQYKWGLEELERRNEILMDRALKIWVAPKTLFQPINEEKESYSLEDDIDLSGRDIARFSYKNVDFSVKSWIDMMERMIRILHEEDKSVLLKIANASAGENELSAYISCKPQVLREALEIDANIYLEKNTSTAFKLSILRKLFNAYELDSDDLVFYLKDESSEEGVSTESARHELHRRYWSLALPYIKDIMGNNGPFSNRSPSKDNWLSGFIGIRGFHITCIANANEARIEMSLVHSEKERNKAAYDYLLSCKTEIEASLGIPLVWRRLDDKKASLIQYSINDVSIESESDWIQMARFHAEWVKKFYDVIVPLLKEKYLKLS